MTPVFPFSAVIGQDSLKLALLLNAIDPALGGVLVTGPRGVAKTTLARALAELVPGRFVELPLAATEERVAGTLDLSAALGEGRVEFSPGLLARAHDGVLYVDEVNLLPDPLVDLLLDAAASGRNVVERDAVSHVHPARFVLIGTMNPEEGELRPQLIDRFGLVATAEGSIEPALRVEIVRRRLEFDRDPEAFVARFAGAQRELIERCARARERAATLPLTDATLQRVTERCHAAGVEGVRADLAMLRAARAHAAWHKREEIGESDIEAVAELALAHRRRGAGRGPGGGAQGGGAGGGRGAGSARSAADGGEAEAGGAAGGEPARSGEAPSGDDADARSGPSGQSAQPGSSGRSQPIGSHVSSGARAREPAADGGQRRAPGRISHPAADGGGGALPAIPVPALARIELPSELFQRGPRARRAQIGRRAARGRHDVHGPIDWAATLTALRVPANPTGAIELATPTTSTAPATPTLVIGSARSRPGPSANPTSAIASATPADSTAPSTSTPVITSARAPFPGVPQRAVSASASAQPPTGRRPLQADLRYRARRLPDRQLWVIAIDCSASMRRGGALSAAKSVALSLHERALRLGAHVGLISFRGQGAVREASARAGRSAFTQAVAALGASGGTPLRIAFREMLALCETQEFRGRGVPKRLWLLTDGRSRDDTDMPALPPDSELIVIDCERDRVRLGRASRVADALGGRCLHVDSLI
jgi:magnesium chelatase subunit I